MNFFKFLKRNFKTPYNLIFLNRNTLGEDYKVNFSPWKVISVLAILVISFFVAGIFVRNLFKTNTLTASDIDAGKVEELRKEVEKLNDQATTNDEYLKNVQKILNGETPELDETVATIEGDPTMDTGSSPNEQEHSDAIPNTSNDNVGATSQQLITNSYREENTYKFYFTPLRGIITNGYQPEKNHYGLDIVAKSGEPIKSIADGVVLFADWTSSTGYVVMIQHANNVISVYKHNSQVYKKIGDNVKMGEVIAAVGNTGELTTGPHLHFEIWVNGQPRDPQKYISF